MPQPARLVPANESVSESALEIALAHASLGRRVFPFRLFRPPGSSRLEKKPYVKWQDRATTDADQIRTWGATWPRASWGWVLDPGLVVVDIDDAEAFAATGLSLPETASQATPSGGSHHLYAGDARQTVKEIAGIDTRVGGKGWVGLYAADSFTGEPVAAPDWLLAPKASVGPTQPTDESPITSRSDILEMVGRWRWAGLSGEEILSGLRSRYASGLITESDETRPWLDSDFAAIAAEFGAKAPGAIEKPVALSVVFQRSEAREPVDAATDPRYEPISAVDLLALDIPPLIYVIEDILPEGTAILAAEPKIGKSWLAYQMCVEIALDGYLLEKKVKGGSSLYYALEDGRRRGQDRLRRTLAGRSMPDKMDIKWMAPKIGRGMEEDIERWLDAHQDASLVVIDTLQKARPPSTGKRDSYQVDVEDLGRVQNVFRDRSGIALVIVHHTRKMKSDDFLAEVSGTYGVTGSVDTTLVLKRKRLEQIGKLDVTSRDAAEGEYHVKFDVDNGLWTVSSDPAGLSDLDNAVYRWLTEHGPAKVTEIALALSERRESVARCVGDMVEGGALVKVAYGVYDIPVRVVRS